MAGLNYSLFYNFLSLKYAMSLGKDKFGCCLIKMLQNSWVGVWKRLRKFTFFDLIVVKMCGHSREVTEYLTSSPTDIFVLLLKSNLFLVFTPNISTSSLKSANVKLFWSMFWPLHTQWHFSWFHIIQFWQNQLVTVMKPFLTCFFNSLPILNKPIHSTRYSHVIERGTRHFRFPA